MLLAARRSGLPENAYFQFGGRIQQLMDQPGCRLQIYWRNFWSACGDPARYVWMKSEQATGRSAADATASRSNGAGKTGLDQAADGSSHPWATRPKRKPRGRRTRAMRVMRE